MEQSLETHSPQALTEAAMNQRLFWLRVFSAGLGSGALMNAEAAQWFMEGQGLLKEAQAKDEEPPRPPRRPNVRIGRLALGDI